MTLQNFYYSYTLDLTHSLQFNMLNWAKKPAAKDMYTWNRFLLEPFYAALTEGDQCRDWGINLIHGFFEQTRERDLHFLRSSLITAIAAQTVRCSCGL